MRKYPNMSNIAYTIDLIAFYIILSLFMVGYWTWKMVNTFTRNCKNGKSIYPYGR